MNNLVNRTEMSVSDDTIVQFVLVKFFTLPVHNFSSNVTYRLSTPCFRGGGGNGFDF
jgi:hypothetical protein